MADAMRSATEADNVEARLHSIIRAAIEIHGKAVLIADKIGGSIPSSESQPKPEVPTNIRDHLREIERVLAHAYENLNRAETGLG